MSLIPILCAALAAAPPAPKPTASPARKAAETQTGGYRIVVERLQQTQNVTLEFEGAEKGPDAPPRVTGRQMIYVGLAIYPPTPKQVGHIEGLDQKILAFGGREPITFQSYVADDANPLASGVWRTHLMAQEVGLEVSKLHRLQGELVVYPRARTATLELPLAEKLPLAREGNGYRITLRSVKRGGGNLTVAMESEWPADATLTRINPETSDGIIAVTRAGTPLIPRRESMSAGRRGDTLTRQFTLVFSDAGELPVKLVAEMLVRSGAPKRLPFTLPDVPLPDTMNLLPELQKAAGETGPVEDDHPLYAAGGGSLRVPLRGVSTGSGRLFVGLSRREKERDDAWRWVEAPFGTDGVAVVTNLKPGDYRVALSWTMTPRAGVAEPARPPAGPMIAEVTLAAGKSVSLAPFLPEGQR